MLIVYSREEITSCAREWPTKDVALLEGLGLGVGVGVLRAELGQTSGRGVRNRSAIVHCCFYLPWEEVPVTLKIGWLPNCFHGVESLR